MRQDTHPQTATVIGLDLGNRVSHACVVDRADGRVLERFQLPTTRDGMQARFLGRARSLVVLEASGPSPWVSRLLVELGHEVHVANTARLSAITQSQRKTDVHDAEMLARLGRSELGLLGRSVTHRCATQQAHLELIKARDALVRARTALINHVRGVLKSMGHRVPTCSAEAFHLRAQPVVPAEVAAAVEPLLAQIDALTASIRGYDRKVDELARAHYPITKSLRKVNGVGPLTSLAFVLVIGDPTRFRHSRSLGSYVGLTPASEQSGESDPQLGITKAGNAFLRRLLVNSAQYTLGPFGEDSALRRFGLARMARGGQNAKRRAVVAVARKLAVLLHRLWVTGRAYEPLLNARTLPEALAAKA
jgi:transposase